MLVLNKKSKRILVILIFCLISCAGYVIERFEKDAFIMETVAVDEAVSYVSSSSSAYVDGRVNINTASKDDLVALDGIGDAMAERIINYREKNGAFETVEEIMKVSGIGRKNFEELKDYICAE